MGADGIISPDSDTARLESADNDCGSYRILQSVGEGGMGTAKSAAVYKDLLAIWNHADPDVPAVQEARAEAANVS